ncbi:MAG: hypothetical protein ACLFTH_01640 [Candidatus Woesearchaeota archaeon]
MKPKLARGKIPEIIETDGENAKTRIVGGDEYWKELNKQITASPVK